MKKQPSKSKRGSAKKLVSSAMNETRLHIVFDNPLQLDIQQQPKPPEPQPEVYGRITISIDNLSVSGENNMQGTCTVGNHYTFSVQWKKKDGSPGSVDGPTTWTSTDDSVMDPVPSTGNPLIANAEALVAGTCQIQANADADLGEGVTPVTAIFDITVIDGQVVGGDITMTDMGSGPPPAA